jgi:hypothetical protein
MRLATCLSVLGILAGIGCANTTVTRIGKPDDYTTKGIRFYGSAPYILVTAPVVVNRAEHLYEFDKGANKLTPVQGAPSRGVASASTSFLGRTAFFANTAGGPSSPPPATGPSGGNGKKQSKGQTSNGASNSAPSATSDGGADPGSSGSSQSDPTAISIVWLPDYCEQYALDATNFFSTQTVKLKLNNGWQFDNIESTGDTTAVASKLLDTASSLASTFKGTSGSASKSSGGTGTKSTSTDQAAAIVVVRHTVTSILKPGIYPLFKRTKCQAEPGFSSPEWATETQESWSEMPVSQ